MTDLTLDIIRQINMVQRQVDGLVFPERSIDLISPFQALPGLVGFWPMSSIRRSNGGAYDESSQGRTLTYNGNPVYSYDGLVPYVDLDGAGDYLSRADETDFDILGTETIYANPGVTFGGWFLPNTTQSGTTVRLISKGATTGNVRAYSIYYDDSVPTFRCYVSDDGSSAAGHFAAVSQASLGGWELVICRWIPNTSITLFVNQNSTAGASAIASIYNSNVGFAIGGQEDGTLLCDTQASCCFVCAQALSDAIISSLFQSTRGAFKV